MTQPAEPSGGLARFIQYTLIRAGVTEAELARHCEECVRFGFHAAMVPASWVTRALELLRGTGVLVASAVDFPLGVMTTEGRVCETRRLVEQGAHEIDVTIHLDWFRSGWYGKVQDDLRAVVEAAGPVPVKVMLELPLLTPDQRLKIVDLAVASGVSWVKNASSGTVGVATPDDIRFLRERLPSQVRVKASGGIKTFKQVRELLAAGADLVGTSNGPAIVLEASREGPSSDPSGPPRRSARALDY